jgi:hypothetical protein
MTETEWLTCTDPRPMLEYLKGPESTEVREMFGRLIPITTHNAKRISEPKSRLFAVACCRQLPDLYDESHCRRLIDYGLRCDVFEARGFVIPEADCCLKTLELAERAADEAVSEAELRALAEAADALHHPGEDYAASHDFTDEYDHRLVATSEVAYAIHYACSDYPAHYSVFGQPSGAFENLGGVVWNTAQAAAWRKGLAYVKSTEGGDPDNMPVNAALLRDVLGNPFRPVRVDPSWRLWNDGTVVKIAQGIYEERAFDRLPILHDALLDAGCDCMDILTHCRSVGPHERGCWVVDLVLGKG